MHSALKALFRLDERYIEYIFNSYLTTIWMYTFGHFGGRLD